MQQRKQQKQKQRRQQQQQKKAAAKGQKQPQSSKSRKHSSSCKAGKGQLQLRQQPSEARPIDACPPSPTSQQASRSLAPWQAERPRLKKTPTEAGEEPCRFDSGFFQLRCHPIEVEKTPCQRFRVFSTLFCPKRGQKTPQNTEVEKNLSPARRGPDPEWCWLLKWGDGGAQFLSALTHVVRSSVFARSTGL